MNVCIYIYNNSNDFETPYTPQKKKQKAQDVVKFNIYHRSIHVSLGTEVQANSAMARRWCPRKNL